MRPRNSRPRASRSLARLERHVADPVGRENRLEPRVKLLGVLRRLDLGRDRCRHLLEFQPQETQEGVALALEDSGGLALEFPLLQQGLRDGLAHELYLGLFLLADRGTDELDQRRALQLLPGMIYQG